MGTHQVSGIILEKGYFLSKFKTVPNEAIEIISPIPITDEVDNEFGKIFQEDGKWFVMFYKLIAKDGREWDSVHSGNLNPIKLPTDLAINTFFRVKINK